MRAKPVCIFCIAVILSAFSSPDADVPFLTGRVTDNANLLSAETLTRLTDSLRVHEMRTTNQVVVLTIPTLDGGAIEDYANRVFNEWKLGREDKDNGILIIVVPNDRRMRIEVGYGLEGILTDLTASHIIQYIMTPKFREGDYDGGIADGTLAVLDVLEGGYLEEGLSAMDNVSSGGIGYSDFDNSGMTITERILIGAFVFGIIGLFTLLGIVTPGGVGWFLFVFLIPFWATFPIIVLGTRGALICLISYLVIYPAAKLFLRNSEWYRKARSDLATKGTASIGGFTISSGSSGGSWSSGGSSGGFSGGGGRSGGGGSSGSW